MENSAFTIKILLLASALAHGWASCTHGKRVLQANETFEDCETICRCGSGPSAECETKCGKPRAAPSAACPNPKWRQPEYGCCRQNVCDPCPKGRWGIGCAMSCGNCTLPECHISTGHCPTAYPTCQMGYTGPRCVESCPEGYYGAACASECGHCRGGRKCNAVTGECPIVPFSLCLAGWKGSTCKMECDRGTYGPDCANQCACQGDCDRITGACGPTTRTGTPEPRRSQTLGPRACPEGRWGANCSEPCGHCTRPDCHAGTGNCPFAYPTCQMGYAGPRCNRTCETGRYGAGCASKCGRCRDGGACDAVNGECPVTSYSLCQAGWMGSRCDMECEVGTHGPDCANKCACPGSGQCDRITGACGAATSTRRPQPKTTRPPGSSQGRGGSRLGCPPGKFGTRCQLACGGCAAGPTCHAQTGACPINVPRCQDGFVGETCNQCGKGTWGAECGQNCSEHCSRGRLECDARDGTCLGGCRDGFEGDRCETAASDLGLVIGLAVGGVLLVLLVTAVLVAICFCRRRRQQPALQAKADYYLTPMNPPGGPLFIPETRPSLNPPDLLELSRTDSQQSHPPKRPPVALPVKPALKLSTTAPHTYERAGSESPEHIYCSATQSQPVLPKPPASYISLI